MKISIVIPTLNEEKYLPKLLKSIRSQDFDDYEIIVADAGSLDRTRHIAKRYGAKVVKGGMPGPGRNAGASAAIGEFIFFLDSDVILPKNFLKMAYDELQDRFLDIATCEFQPISKNKIDKLLHSLSYSLIKLRMYTNNPMIPGFVMMVTRRLHERIGGFDADVKLSEDNDYVVRASKFRPLRTLDNVHVKVSVRRLDKEGRLKLAAKYIMIDIYRGFHGEITKKGTFNYDFGHSGRKKQDKKFLQKEYSKIETQLSEINSFFKKLGRTKETGPGCDDEEKKKDFLKVKKTFNDAKKKLIRLIASEQNISKKDKVRHKKKNKKS